MTRARDGRPRVVLGVCGGIAAYKAVEVCRRLVDAGVHVAPVLTERATRFVGAGHLLRPGLRAGADARCGTRPRPIPHTRLGPAGRPGRGGAGHRRPARPLRRRAGRRPADDHAGGHAAHRWWCARPCTPRCGSTRRSGTTWPRSSAAGVDVVPPEERAAGRGRLGRGPAGRPGDHRRRACWSGCGRAGRPRPARGPRAGRQRRRHAGGHSTPCASSPTGRRASRAMPWPSPRRRRGADGRRWSPSPLPSRPTSAPR